MILKNNEPFTTSIIIAEQLKRKHFSIIKLINENKSSFDKFGVIQPQVEEPKKELKFCQMLKLKKSNKKEPLAL